jgi:hypothetical protein
VTACDYEEAIIYDVPPDPTSLGEFSKVAPYLTNPLVLIGFVLLLFFGVHRVLIKSGVLVPVSRTASGKIVRLLLHYGFVVALLLILCGFGLAYFKTKGTQPKKGDATTTGPQSPAVTGDGNHIDYGTPPPENKPPKSPSK